MDKREQDWSVYISYLFEWANDHADARMSPACFDEWDDMENDEEED